MFLEIIYNHTFFFKVLRKHELHKNHTISRKVLKEAFECVSQNCNGQVFISLVSLIFVVINFRGFDITVLEICKTLYNDQINTMCY